MGAQAAWIIFPPLTLPSFLADSEGLLLLWGLLASNRQQKSTTMLADQKN
jgi:hypothetical protein